MNNEKEIERIAKIVYDNYLDSKTCARELQANGIGDKKQTIKEFVEKLKELSYWQCDSNGDSNKVVTIQQIDNLITELYGADY